MDISGQGIFNILVVILGALAELWPAFGDWWVSYKWRDLVFLAACFAVAGAFLGACAAGLAVQNCSYPVDWDDALVAAQAAITAFGLFQAARLFVRGGMFSVRAIIERLRYG